MAFVPIQFVSLAATVVVFMLSRSTTVWFSLVFALGFVHYLLGVLYAHRQAARVISRASSLLPAALVLGAGAALYVNDVPLYLYFAVHHAFNEVYVRGALHADMEGAALRRTAGVMFHFAAYVLILTVQRLSPVELAAVGGAMLVALSIYMGSLIRVRREMGPGRLLDLYTIELVMLALVVAAFFYRFSFEQVVFYHFVFWGLYPLSRMVQSRDTGAGLRYAMLTVAAFALFVLLSPLGPPVYSAPVRVYYEQFIFWSYAHITLSFILSRAHPAWITSWFAPRPAAAVGSV